MITETNVKDFMVGKRDREAGYYDKWYRYNHKDNGAAYDAGCMAAVASGNVPDNCVIIEAN